MIACFLSNISDKYYKNPSMLSRVIAKNVGDVFFWDTVSQYLENSHNFCQDQDFPFCPCGTSVWRTRLYNKSPASLSWNISLNNTCDVSTKSYVVCMTEVLSCSERTAQRNMMYSVYIVLHTYSVSIYFQNPRRAPCGCKQWHSLTFVSAF